jgi:hypothetical protein
MKAHGSRLALWFLAAIALLLNACAATGEQDANQQKMTALIIGNGDYRDGIPSLANPPHGTKHRFSGPSHRRQCGDVTLRMLVTPLSTFLPFSAKIGDACPSASEQAPCHPRPSLTTGAP